MIMQSTSLKSYDEIRKGLTKKQRSVYWVLPNIEGKTNSELSEILGWTINRVTGRIFELRELDLVEAAGKRKCKTTGRTAMTWRTKNPGKARQMEMSL